MTIHDVPIGQINESPYNPRTHTEKELKAVKKSLKEFGFVEPLVVNETTGNLVGGHLRLKASKELGFKTVPVYKVKLSEIEEKTLNITLNSHTAQGKFEENMLATLLEEIKYEVPEMHLEMNFDQLSKDLKIDFKEQEFEVPDQEKQKKLEFLTCPNCNEPFEKSQAK
jgi:ParB-like chromosome segregation protein Spo0J